MAYDVYGFLLADTLFYFVLDHTILFFILGGVSDGPHIGRSN